ncbi:MAG: histidine kinase [Candidatus Neomarinimicrobiota bacterium]
MREELKIQLPFQKALEKNWVQHLLFWLAYLVLFTTIHLLRGIHEGEALSLMQFELFHLVGLIVVVYSNLRVLIPRLLDKKHYLVYAIAVFVLALTVSIVVHYLAAIFLGSPPAFRGEHHPRRPQIFIMGYMMMNFFFIAISSFLHYVKKSTRLNEIALRVKDLESSKLQAELDSLKAQINPHFLFNTLNNIYSHSLFKSDQTSEMILKLSGLMNYIIYDCRDDRVSLSREVEFINNYVALEKVRIDEDVETRVEIDVPPNGHRVAPLLFIPLLENAFKHGVNLRTGQSLIVIRLTVDDNDRLRFFIENALDGDAPEVPESAGGIGLENVRKRLELIYPGRHRLEIERTDGKFRVCLTIDLK